MLDVDEDSRVSDQGDDPRPMVLLSVEDSEGITVAGEVVQSKSFQLNVPNLEHVMSQVELGLPVAIISVVGAFRSGKSFLLSCFLKILESEEANERENAFQGGKVGGRSGGEGGFSWKGGIEGHTQGMMVWSRPFIREVDDGEGGRTKMAVLLVDTQGAFDNEMDPQLEACLFGLTTTVSSCQIFNVKDYLRVDNLGGLAVLLEYADVGKTRFGETAGDDGGGGGDGEEVERAPFQRLEILIRDWQGWEESTDRQEFSCEQLHSRFLEYLGDILDTPTTNTIKIKGCFEDSIGCFGLPHPGLDVASPWFDGDVAKISPGFIRLVIYYLTDVILGKLDATNPSVLPNTGVGDFVSSFESWVEFFSDGMTYGQLPKATSWLGVMFDIMNTTLTSEKLRIFEQAMEERTRSGNVDATELEALLEEHKQAALNAFRPRGDEDRQAAAKEEFRRQLDNESSRMKIANERRKPSSFWSSLGIGAVAVPNSAVTRSALVMSGVVLCVGMVTASVPSPLQAVIFSAVLLDRFFPSFLGGRFTSREETPEEPTEPAEADIPEAETGTFVGEERGIALRVSSTTLWAIFGAILALLIVEAFLTSGNQESTGIGVLQQPTVDEEKCACSERLP